MIAHSENNSGDQAGSSTPDAPHPAGEVEEAIKPVASEGAEGLAKPLVHPSVPVVAETISDPSALHEKGEALGGVDTAQVSSVWKVVRTDEVRPISLRAIWPKGGTSRQPAQNLTFTAARYPTAAERRRAFEGKAAQLSTEGYNVYVVMNPIREDFSGGAVTDADIAFRDLLLIDIDRAGSSKDPASEEEVEAAVNLADKIAAEAALRELHLRARVMSGNGVHLYFSLEQMANDEASTAEVKELLQLLARKFDTDTLKIDQCVYNASRITKVPGTVARKGRPSAGRPYRIAMVIWP